MMNDRNQANAQQEVDQIIETAKFNYRVYQSDIRCSNISFCQPLHGSCTGNSHLWYSKGKRFHNTCSHLGSCSTTKTYDTKKFVLGMQSHYQILPAFNHGRHTPASICY